MECPSCKDNLTAYLDEELNEKDQEQVQWHLRQCPACAAEFESLAQSYWLVNGSTKQIEVPADLWGRIEAEISPRSFAARHAAWRGLLLSPFQTPPRRLATSLIGVAALAVLLWLFQQAAVPPDPETEALRQQLNVMVEQMDRRGGYSGRLAPAAAREQDVNPFAVQDLSLEFNPFRVAKPEIKDPLMEALGGTGTAGLQIEASGIRESR
ncbi:MAG: zf-HC2 domain-containing protein [Acidobacteria bacterium]|nr:zf-HC2 domain-containing protein [Acidobacteriota bacterium]